MQTDSMDLNEQPAACGRNSINTLPEIWLCCGLPPAGNQLPAPSPLSDTTDGEL